MCLHTRCLADNVLRRHADRTGQLWLQRMKDSGSNKRLNLIYLANGQHFPANPIHSN